MFDFLHLINPLYALSGLAVGALVGFTGVGGGSLMTPLLVLLFGIHPATAVGTDLLYAGLTKICGSAVHSRNDAIDWRVTPAPGDGQRARCGAGALDAVAFRGRIEGNQHRDHDDARLRAHADRDHADLPAPLAPHGRGVSRPALRRGVSTR